MGHVFQIIVMVGNLLFISEMRTALLLAVAVQGPANAWHIPAQGQQQAAVPSGPPQPPFTLPVLPAKASSAVCYPPFWLLAPGELVLWAVPGGLSPPWLPPQPHNTAAYAVYLTLQISMSLEPT